MPSAPPKIMSAQVVAAQPTDADAPMIAALSSELDRRLPSAAFIVKIALDKAPEPTGAGWALYVGDTRIPKYWEYPAGIYFKVFDETFLADHRGAPLRFSQNGQEFVKTGVRLPGTEGTAAIASGETRSLPRQSDVLSGVGSPRPVRARAARTREVKATTRKRAATRRRKGSKTK